MFWGLVLEPSKKYTQKVAQTFHISQAALDLKSTDQEPVQLIVEYENSNFVLATLSKKANIFQVALDLIFKAGDQVSFRTIGNGKVHLSGYHILDDLDSALLEGEEESDYEEIEVKDTKKKRKKNNANKKDSKKVRLDETNEDESDESSCKNKNKLLSENSKKKMDKSISSNLKLSLMAEDGDEDDDDDDDDDDDYDYDYVDDDNDDNENEDDDDDDDDDDDNDDDDEEEEDLEFEEEDSEEDMELEDDDFDSDNENEHSMNEKPVKKNLKSPNKKPQNGIHPASGSKEKNKQQKSNQNQIQEGNTKKGTPNKTPTDKVDRKNDKQSKMSGGEGTPKRKGPDDAKGGDKTPKSEGTGEKRVLEGGITVEEVKLGSGAVAKPGKTVNVYYVGSLQSTKKQFDSVQHGSGFKFILGKNEVIKGWDIGLNGMKVGGIRKLTIPPYLAYGAKGSPPVIPPNSTLIFTVELRSIS